MELHLGLWEAREGPDLPRPDYKQLPETSPDGRLGLLASVRRLQLPTLAQPLALLRLASFSPFLGLSGAQGDPLFLTTVAPSCRGTLWPLLHSPAPSA